MSRVYTFLVGTDFNPKDFRGQRLLWVPRRAAVPSSKDQEGDFYAGKSLVWADPTGLVDKYNNRVRVLSIHYRQKDDYKLFVNTLKIFPTVGVLDQALALVNASNLSGYV